MVYTVRFYLKSGKTKMKGSVKTHDYTKHATEYSELGIDGTFYLGFRDVPKLIKKYVKGTQALDYGCGPGRSTRFLKSLGFDVIGVDISSDMLTEARKKDEQGTYQQIERGVLPLEDSSFDLIFSSFVFLEIAAMIEIEKILSEFKRVLKPSGHIIILTSSMEGYKGDWVSVSYDFPENKRQFESGETVKLLIRGTNVILHDYYWTDQDYRDAFTKIHLRLIELHNPIGYDEDKIQWREESQKSPYSIYVLAKT